MIENKRISKLSIFIYMALIQMTFTQNVYAFNKLKNGFETITNTYLMPLTGAVAGAALITFITLSYFKQEENQKKVAGVLALTVMAAAGLEVLKAVIQSFS